MDHVINMCSMSLTKAIPMDNTASAPYIPYTPPLGEYMFRVYYPIGLSHGRNDSAHLHHNSE